MQLNTIYESVDYSLNGASVPVMSSREYGLIDAGVAESEPIILIVALLIILSVLSCTPHLQFSQEKFDLKHDITYDQQTTGDCLIVGKLTNLSGKTMGQSVFTIHLIDYNFKTIAHERYYRVGFESNETFTYIIKHPQPCKDIAAAYHYYTTLIPQESTPCLIPIPMGY